MPDNSFKERAMNKRVAVWKKTRRFQNLWTKMKTFRSQELSLASALLVLVSFTLKEQIIDLGHHSH
jgi:hypothetical protein